MISTITITDFGVLVTSAVATVGCILGVVRFWLNRSDQKLTKLVNTTREDLLVALANNIERQFSDQDKNTYLTLDYRMDGDVKCIRIPLSYNKVTECLQGMRLQLVDNSTKETVYSVSTLGFGAPVRLHWHYHEETEIVQIIKGVVTDVHTGRKYGPGEVWTIPPEARHIADFDNAFVICTVRPPLPWASQHPIDLEGMRSLYSANRPRS